MILLIILFCVSYANIINYTLVIEYKWMMMDNFSKAVVAVNGGNVGPIIRTNEGDILRISIVNNLFKDGITIHWHGMRLFGKPYLDGVPGITQCLLGPGTNVTYEFVTDRFGTYWYHAHVESQRDDAFYGALIVDKITPYVFDIEHIIFLSDFYHSYSEEQILMLKSKPFEWVGPPQNILINGELNYRINVTYNKTYLIRFISAVADSYINISIPRHNVTIVEVEGTYTVPYVTSNIWINAGERYTILFTANNPGCYNMTISSMNSNVYNNLGLFYDNCTGKVISGSNTNNFDTINLQNLYPDILPAPNKNLTITFGTHFDHQLGKTYIINNISFDFPIVPILLDYYKKTYGGSSNIISVELGDVIDIDIVNPLEQHPFHIHGHSFYVLGSRSINGTIINSATNPIHRDTITIPKNTTIKIRIIFDNPGVWLSHCHITWHVIMGMSIVFAYNPNSIPLPPDNFMICGKSVMGAGDKRYFLELILIALVIILVLVVVYFVFRFIKYRQKNRIVTLDPLIDMETTQLI